MRSHNSSLEFGERKSERSLKKIFDFINNSAGFPDYVCKIEIVEDNLYIIWILPYAIQTIFNFKLSIFFVENGSYLQNYLLIPLLSGKIIHGFD